MSFDKSETPTYLREGEQLTIKQGYEKYPNSKIGFFLKSEPDVLYIKVGIPEYKKVTGQVGQIRSRFKALKIILGNHCFITTFVYRVGMEIGDLTLAEVVNQVIESLKGGTTEFSEQVEYLTGLKIEDDGKEKG